MASAIVVNVSPTSVPPDVSPPPVVSFLFAPHCLEPHESIVESSTLALLIILPIASLTSDPWDFVIPLPGDSPDQLLPEESLKRPLLESCV